MEMMTKHFKFIILIFLFFPLQIWADSQTLRPTSNRGETDWVDYPTAGDDYEKIDDITPDADGTYLYADGL